MKSQLVEQLIESEPGIYVVSKTVAAIKKGVDPQTAFKDACEDENYYGNRPDIVADRVRIAATLKNKYRIIVNPNI